MISLLVIERSVLKVFSELSDDDSKHVLGIVPFLNHVRLNFLIVILSEPYNSLG